MALFRRLCRRNVGFKRFVLGIVFIYFYCNYITYYVIQIQCGWPSLNNEPTDGVKPVHALILADIHLLGPEGQWYDKWRREWMMHRGFQTALTLHSPEVVFILGDLFDNGTLNSEKEFNEFVHRFHSLFSVPEDTPMYTVAGNHDIGFHYRMIPHIASRFEEKLDVPPVQLITIRGNHFVLINSIAMQGDRCSLCERAVTEIDRIADILKCSNGSALCKGKTKLESYSRPILMQHFPLYRESDRKCTGPDVAPLPERNDIFEERVDCLSEESTEYLIKSLLPRSAFGGHTHYSCEVRHSFVPTHDHKIEFIEYSIPSFSCRYRWEPKYYLATITPNEVKVSKCGMPRELTMQVTAILMTVALIVYLGYSKTNDKLIYYKHLLGKKVSMN